MTKDKRPDMQVITNDKLNTTAPPDVGKANKNYHTSPFYEKLLKYRSEQKRKRFSVQDLLKW